MCPERGTARHPGEMNGMETMLLGLEASRSVSALRPHQARGAAMQVSPGASRALEQRVTWGEPSFSSVNTPPSKDLMENQNCFANQ